MKKDADYLFNLVKYVKNNLSKGYSKDSLRWALVNQGHSKLEIEKAFKRAEEEMTRDNPSSTVKPKISYELVEAKDLAQNVQPEKQSFWKRLFG